MEKVNDLKAHAWLSEHCSVHPDALLNWHIVPPQADDEYVLVQVNLDGMRSNPYPIKVPYSVYETWLERE